MNKALFLILTSVFFFPLAYGQKMQEPTPYKLIVNTPFNTPKDAKIFVTSSSSACTQKPDCISGIKLSLNQWQFNLSRSQLGELSISRGNEQTFASDSSGSKIAPKAFFKERSLKIEIINVVNWTDFGELKKVGNFQEFDDFYSPELNNKRKIVVRLPDDYHHSNKAYPVIYMHDGQNSFDYKETAYGVDWSMDDRLSKMVKEGLVRDAIVVGIYHKERGREFNYEDQGHLYSKFLVKTVKPLIDRSFRTLPDKKNSFLLGSSYGSIISFTTLWLYPDVFGRAAGLAFHAGFFSNMLFRFLNSVPTLPLDNRIYLDHGDQGMDKFFFRANRIFIDELSRRLPKGQFQYFTYKYTDHTETDWARRLHIPLKFLLD
ncbi:MAG: alpha/beta hydrolase [Bacteriovoracaceae bacterium]